MITRNESNALRGLAILGIVLHNYTHWLGPMVQENEYTFSIHNVRRLMMEMAMPSENIIAHLLSFFGHYGVPVFLFLSAYGLVMKYESVQIGERQSGSSLAEQQSESALSFIWKHYKKLFAMMIVGYAAYVMVDYMTPGPRHYTFWNVVGQIGMFSNLYDDPDHDIWPGPYWYFGLMVQVYVFFRLIVYRGRYSLASMMSPKQGKMVLIALMIIATGAQCFFEPEGSALEWYRYNIFGSVLPFGLGIIYARAVKSGGEERSLIYDLLTKSSKTVLAAACVVSAFLIVYMSMNFYQWTLVPVMVCVFSLLLVKLLPQAVLSPLAWVGGISAAMFVSHPIARKVIIPISRHGDLYAGLLLYLVAAIVLGMLFKRIINNQ